MALYRNRANWLQHPVIGAPSWDTFQREIGNPIYVGRDLMLWPVNGFLFLDPQSNRWFSYIALYPRGYWPPGGALCLEEKKDGQWLERGLVLQGDATLFDGENGLPGATPDVSVVFSDGKYHMVYDWCNRSNTRGGIAYAWADHPQDPFMRTTIPIHEDIHQEPILGIYQRCYAATLIERDNDWLILCMMSTPQNAGGTWALACMIAEHPEGPYGKPSLLLYPQTNIFHPPLAEFFPAFVQGDFIYAPATSVAANRTFQTVFRAPREQAHNPNAWQIFQYGSVWHDEACPQEASGIWGQTFSGQISRNDTLRVLFPAKTKDDIGVINMARRHWQQPFKDGFILSAPNAAAAAILRQHYQHFNLHMRARANGPWSLVIGSQSPLGPDRATANARLHPLMHTHCLRLRLDEKNWSLFDNQNLLHQGTLACSTALINLGCETGRCFAEVNGVALFSEILQIPTGRIELLAEKGTVLTVEEFTITGRPLQCQEEWLASEALSGSADYKEYWQPVQDSSFYFGQGYIAKTAAARAKWNYQGQGFKLWSPKGPEYGSAELIVDGSLLGEVNFHAPACQRSTCIFIRDLSAGFHCVILKLKKGIVPLDILQITP